MYRRKHKQHRQNSTKSGEEHVVGELLMHLVRFIIPFYVWLLVVNATCKLTFVQKCDRCLRFFDGNMTQVGTWSCDQGRDRVATGRDLS
jgi:hypothetical protein